MANENSDLERARREFLDECDLVVRVPATINVSGTPATYEYETMAVPMYSYIGVMLGTNALGAEFFAVKPEADIGTRPITITDMHRKDIEISQGTLQALEEFIKRYNLRFLDTKRPSKKNPPNKFKYKFWLEVPPSGHIQTNLVLGSSMLETSLLENIGPEEFNSLKSTYKGLCIREGKYLLAESAEHRSDQESKAVDLLRKIFIRRFKEDIFEDNGASVLCSLMGALDEKKESIDHIWDFEGIHYKIPLVPKKEMLELLPSQVGQNLTVDWVEVRVYLEALKKKETVRSYMANYLNEVIEKDKIEVSRRKNILKATNIAFLIWKENVNGFFGPILEPFCSNGVRDFGVDINEGFFTEYEKEDSEKIGGKITFRYNNMVIRGNSKRLDECLREIEKLQKGVVHYCSLSPHLRFLEGGIRFLLPDEYKLPKERVTISEEIPETRMEEERLKTEPRKYLVFIQYPNKIGTKPMEASEEVVKKKYLPRSNEYDIFVYGESVHVRHDKKMVEVSIQARLRKLLIVFLRYKDLSIPPIPLYRKAWAFEHAPERLTSIKHDSDVTPHLKTAKSQLLAKINKYVPSFEIRKYRNQGYICKGSFSFCVIVDGKDDKKYRLTEAKETEGHF